MVSWDHLCMVSLSRQHVRASVRHTVPHPPLLWLHILGLFRYERPREATFLLPFNFFFFFFFFFFMHLFIVFIVYHLRRIDVLKSTSSNSASATSHIIANSSRIQPSFFIWLIVKGARKTSELRKISRR